MARSSVLLVPAVVLITLKLSLTQDIELPDICNDYSSSCTDCISSSFSCVWCPDPQPYSGPCTSLSNANCSVELENPIAEPPMILRNLSFSDEVQISPQEFELQLRRGEPQTFMLSVKPSTNYPLDMYFLMDLSSSQSQDLDMLRRLSNTITSELENISSQYAVGFGSYLDKVAYPFASTLQNGRDYILPFLDPAKPETCVTGTEQCFPTYDYRHQLSLTSSSSNFSDALNMTTIHANIDAPEDLLNALIQTITCSDIIGWREGSLRLIMVITDAGYKTALDGKLAALLPPHNGLCQLEQNDSTGFYQYIGDTDLDYPTLYQVRNLLIENDVIPIFAVTEDVLEDYEETARELGSSRAFAQQIMNDSSDIVEVIQRAYQAIIRDVVVDPIPGLDISISPVHNCTPLVDQMGCANVALDQLVSFNVTVAMDQCQGSEEPMYILSLPGFGSVPLTIKPLCDCNCSAFSVENHTSCNSQGSLTCGLCTCNDGFYGEQCNCTEPLGECSRFCLECDNCSRQCLSCRQTTDLETGITLGRYGEMCQCENETKNSKRCGVDANNTLCSGRGECECNTDFCECRCTCDSAPLTGRAYFGDGCMCNPDDCFNPAYPGKLCAFTGTEQVADGMCDCEGCRCPEGSRVVNKTCAPVCPSGSRVFNKTCVSEGDICAVFEECARCGLNCTKPNCTTVPLTQGQGDITGCEYSEGSCTISYEVVITSGDGTEGTVYVSESKNCSSEDAQILSWLIAVIIVGVILAIGAIALIIAKIVLIFVERREYKKFLVEMNEGDFTPHNNPLYVTPQSDYQNPLAKKKKLEM